MVTKSISPTTTMTGPWLPSGAGLVWHLVVVACVCAAAVGFACRQDASVFPVDDAYITLHNARAMLDGTDASFAGISPLTGATSLLHLALLALWMRVLAPLPAACVVLWLGIYAYAAGVLQLCLAHHLPRWKVAAVLVCALLVGLTPYQLTNGLETGWAMAAVAWSFALASGNTAAARYGLAALCGAMPAVRPELTAFAALLLGCQVMQTWHGTRSPERRQALIGIALAACLAALPWCAVYASATGLPFPTTVAAKRVFFAEQGLPSAVKLAWTGGFLWSFALAMGLLTVGYAGLRSTGAGRAGLAFGVILVIVYAVVFPGALGHYDQRYLYVLTPVLLYGLVRLQVLDAPRVRLAASAVLMAAAVQALALSPVWLDAMARKREDTRTNLFPIAAWCNAHLDPSARLLVHDIGYVSWATRFALVDLVGLKSPGSTVWHRRLTGPSGGEKRAEAVDDIARETRPDDLIMLGEWDRIYHLTTGLREHGWRLDAVDNAGCEYRVYRLRRPDASDGR